MKVELEEQRWNAVLGRDERQDGQFVYGVASTRIYCRPSCPSRRPVRSRVSFFETPTEAERAGYRACRRCEPQHDRRRAVRQVEHAREYIDQHPDELVTLERLGQIAQMSPYHLQRTFKRVIGVSPKTYASAQRLDRMKAGLRGGNTVSRATYDAGYESGSRAYAHAKAGLGMTPGAYRNGGRGLRIEYALVPTAVGCLLVAATERGVCAAMLGDDAAQLEGALRQEFPAARLERNDAGLQRYTAAVVSRVMGREEGSVRLHVQGTPFQWQVWEALRRIPAGETRTYQQIARELGRPNAARAVARACASNRVALVIPCHRVVRESGELGGYRWGIERKKHVLEQEQLQRDGRSDSTMTAS
ncbi:MAG TPA: bifunctional DNA-binding transcriptional regulator/O6-methylguanine-DNA methyltransferase Ada [Gemmatimonadales bacterium]|nr:bifunctional DNA-binding transcriptional regulator/O6-methylguanine-DNA methyltransferase Ada [Gemmatimonadales bacterium]